ncbi:dehydrogenase/reductase SDR family member 4-like 2 isoform 4 [Homo sapiens]|uniref:Dehydrogenase/reductase 4 like 2 n=1 Tax=Homo sapiens TaxID=9606 RepID=F6VUV4_HUMAN|nr:dehydrogenase/reductase SDR family member 4-like 2 isoform 4 [Homo sapiens]KAI2570551.1 dehydrogenase/reductase 4 like 2 [Homo sapiens]|eukprot:NP_001180566.1 dehydrogenase/reductase SDR family member 4-like 2 isoform 4 [Homo sapiens]
MAVKLHGGIDILVSNAAVNPFFGSLMDVTEEVWDKGFSPYNVSKTALLGLNNTLAIELAPRNIRVNCLHLDLSRLASAGCSGWTRKKRKA